MPFAHRALCETVATMPRLTIIRGPLAGQQFSFNDDVVVGRGAYCEVRLDDSTVSRRHADIKRGADGRWRMHDLGSANGTFCDGQVVDHETGLADTAEIVFGELATQFEAIDAPPQPASGDHSIPQWMDRIELLTTLGGLPARREDPAHLVGLALEAILTRFKGCSHVTLFVIRPGAATPVALAQRALDGAPISNAALELAQASLRNLDGIAASAAGLRALGILSPPASALAIPLVFAGEVLGAVVAQSARDDTWNATDRALGKALAGVLASLLDTQRSNHPDRRVAERDLALARRVQQHFLPQAAARIAGYAVAEAYVPARAVGGDHYDFFRYADDRIGVIIADVSGKAVSAALVMARFGMAVRLLASQCSGPVELLVTLNILLLDELESGMFVTAQALALAPLSGNLEIANAGHPAPLLRNRDGQVDELVLESGAPLGADARTSFRASTRTLETGTCLLLYSDGLNEAENAAGEPLDIERIAVAIATCVDARSALDKINETLAAFVGSTPLTDDLTLVLISRDAER